MILKCCIVSQISSVDLPAGSIITVLESDPSNVVFLESNGWVVRISNILLTDIVTDDDLFNIDPTRKLEILKNGTKVWYKNGQYHRADGPAVETVNGMKLWYKNGQLHRDDGPAYERNNGTRWWYKNGQYCRNKDPLHEGSNGTKI